MGIVRRCGRPPRSGPGPLIQKPTRERVPVRIAAAGAAGGAVRAVDPPRRDGRAPELAVAAQLVAAAVGAVDRRLPPRIPVLSIALRAVDPVAALDHEADAVICSCRGHAAVTAVR
ncbi:MAG TPA: hypothetical protein VK607_18350 [Kofleriaceae bacterium]|nr:hypothetical protein [Kofleriaceae bacterium]